MKYFCLIAAAMLPMFASAQITRYDADQLRARLFEFNDNPPAQRLIITGETSDPRKREFINYFAEKVFPKFEEIGADIFRYRALSILVDAYLHRTPEEREKWAGEGGDFEKIIEKYNAWSGDPEWTEILATWGKKAEGLEGPLAEGARRMARERELEKFSEDQMPLLFEAERLQKDYFLAVNTAPSAGNIAIYRKQSTEIRRRFKAGEISFEQAQQELHELMRTKGSHIVGYEAVQKAGDNLNKMAVLRSQLAKGKGLKTWAEYALEMSGQGYTPEYRGTANQRAFLKAYIAALRPLREKFIAQRIRELGISHLKDKIRFEDLLFLTPPGRQQLQPYFPAAKIVDIWEETLIENGFKKEDLRQIVADISPREGKNPASAYLSGFTGPYTDEVAVDVDKLAWVVEPKGSSKYKPGFAYILQNFGDSGISDLETLFHEGGHATEKLLKRKNDFTEEAYGYVEVPSMTSERFTRDPLLLWHKAVAHNGKRPTLEEITTLVNNDAKGEIVDTLSMATTALFDLELWDYDYSAPGALTYVERLKTVDQSVRDLAGDPPYVETKEPRHFWLVVTPHFVSGSVRNIGYTYAEIASRMMTDYFTDEIEKLSGRRTWWRQPLLGGLFTERLYEQGWKLPFPANIEMITGRKFSAEQVVKEMAELLEKGDCEAKLKPGA